MPQRDMVKKLCRMDADALGCKGDLEQWLASVVKQLRFRN